MATLDPEVVRHALQVARERGFAEVELGHEESAFYAKLEAEPKKKRKQAAGSDAAAADLPEEPATKPLKATLVGYYIPSSRNPLTVGMKVAKGDVIGVISALGIANDVEATAGGEVLEVFVKDGDPVEYGQPLAMVKP